jgi:hypothetical protein
VLLAHTEAWLSGRAVDRTSEIEIEQLLSEYIDARSRNVFKFAWSQII